jgi:hypothetical protein
VRTFFFQWTIRDFNLDVIFAYKLATPIAHGDRVFVTVATLFAHAIERILIAVLAYIAFAVIRVFLTVVTATTHLIRIRVSADAAFPFPFAHDAYVLMRKHKTRSDIIRRIGRGKLRCFNRIIR